MFLSSYFFVYLLRRLISNFATRLIVTKIYKKWARNLGPVSPKIGSPKASNFRRDFTSGNFPKRNKTNVILMQSDKAMQTTIWFMGEPLHP